MKRKRICLSILIPLLLSFNLCEKKGEEVKEVEEGEMQKGMPFAPSDRQFGPAKGMQDIQDMQGMQPVPGLPAPGGGSPTTFSKAPPSRGGGPSFADMTVETGSVFGPPFPYTPLGTSQILAKLLPETLSGWEVKEIEVGSQVFFMTPVVIVRGNYTEKSGKGRILIYIMMTYQGEFSEATCELIMPGMKEAKEVTIAGQKTFLTYSEGNKVAKLLINPFGRIAIWMHGGEIASEKEVLEMAKKIDFKAVREVSEAPAPPIPQKMIK